MTDVVEIAKECRETLSAEITKLDEFLLMVDKLLKFKGSDRTLAFGADDGTATSTIGRPSSASASANGLDTKA